MNFNLMLLASLTGWAGTPLDIPHADRVAIRHQIKSCVTYLATADQEDDSVGVPLSINEPRDIAAALQHALAEIPAGRFRDGKFFVLGVKMGREQVVRREVEAVLREAGLAAEGARVQVLSVPVTAWQKFKYFWPSYARDYQRPRVDEIWAALGTSAIIETPGLVVIAETLGRTDALMTMGSHVLIVGSIVTFSKSFTNWLLRSGSDREIGASAEIYLKQLLLSVLFVSNYNVMGHSVELAELIAQEGATGLWSHLPQALDVAAGQVPVTLLQTLFFAEVMTKGLGQWMNTQVGTANTRGARSLRYFLQLPFLWIDASAIAAATTQSGGAWATLGPVSINAGEVSLAALVVSSVYLFKRYPKAFDRLLPPYRRLLEHLSLAERNRTRVQ